MLASYADETGHSKDPRRRFVIRTVCCALYALLCSIAFSTPLATLVRLSFEDKYSHILLIPLISLVLLYLERKTIVLTLHNSVGTGAILFSAGVLLYWVTKKNSTSLSQNDFLSVTVLSLVLLWMAGFVACCGTRAFRAAAFPFLFLLLMIPIPDFLLGKIIAILQRGSADVTDVLFKLVGMPVSREGFVFSMRGLDIEIAEECSGTRSAVVFFISSLLAGHLFLRSMSKKIVFALAVFPVMVIKNGLRIVVLSILAVYVNESFVAGTFHRYAGIPFGLVAVGALAPLLRRLQKSEANSGDL